MILEFENVFESELVAALHRALELAKANKSVFTERIESLVSEAETIEADVTALH